MLKEIDHIGIAVDDLQESLANYRDRLGMKFLGVEVVEDQKVRVGILQVGGIRIELLQATSEDSPVAKFRAGGGKGVHHIAYRVDDMDAAIKWCEKMGLSIIEDSRRTGAGGAQIVFLHPRSTAGVLTELTSGMKETDEAG